MEAITLRLITAVAAGLITIGAFAQSPRSTTIPAGTIDGKDNPSLIPEIVAFRLVFAAVAEDRAALPTAQTPNGTPTIRPTARQSMKLGSIELTDDDKSILVDALADFKASLRSLMNPTPEGSSSPSSLDEIAEDAINRLKVRMSSDGFEHLRQFVMAERRNMKRIPIPVMAEHSH